MKTLRIFGICAALTIGLSTLIGAATANAQPSGRQAAGVPYPPITSTSLGVSATALDPCATVTISGADYTPGEQIAVVLHSANVPLGEPTADASGSFTEAVRVPEGLEGPHTISATGLTSGRSATASVTIQSNVCPSRAPAASAAVQVAKSLPNTGFGARNTVIVGGLLLLLGALLVLAGRRRNDSTD